jgi:hypothetical protein
LRCGACNGSGRQDVLHCTQMRYKIVRCQWQRGLDMLHQATVYQMQARSGCMCSRRCWAAPAPASSAGHYVSHRRSCQRQGGSASRCHAPVAPAHWDVAAAAPQWHGDRSYARLQMAPGASSCGRSTTSSPWIPMIARMTATMPRCLQVPTLCMTDCAFLGAAQPSSWARHPCSHTAYRRAQRPLAS